MNLFALNVTKEPNLNYLIEGILSLTEPKQLLIKTQQVSKEQTDEPNNPLLIWNDRLLYVSNVIINYFTQVCPANVCSIPTEEVGSCVADTTYRFYLFRFCHCSHKSKECPANTGVKSSNLS